MTASERLRELGAERGPAWEGRWLDLDGRWVNIDTVLFITERLPLIADVVAAAEDFALRVAEECQNERTYRLDDTLTALRDSLEKP